MARGDYLNCMASKNLYDFFFYFYKQLLRPLTYPQSLVPSKITQYTVFLRASINNVSPLRSRLPFRADLFFVKNQIHAAIYVFVKSCQGNHPSAYKVFMNFVKNNTRNHQHHKIEAIKHNHIMQVDKMRTHSDNNSGQYIETTC